MLKFCDYDIVFAEVPDEVSLAISLSRCPMHCDGCHSPQLWDDVGEALTETRLQQLVDRFRRDITCLCFMGGDADLDELADRAAFVRRRYPELKLAWYSGRPKLPQWPTPLPWNYVKLGPYIAARGPLTHRTTNQRFFRIDPHGQQIDLTARFFKNAW